MDKRTRIKQIDPTKKYWAVSLYETIGLQNIECIVRDIPADNAHDACEKALLMYMRKNGVESRPKLNWCQPEDYSRPIRIRG